MKLHDEDKPFICDVCGKRYHDQNAVKLHMVGHLEVLPFPCTYCDKRFRHKGLLNVSWMACALYRANNYWIEIFLLSFRWHYSRFTCELIRDIGHTPANTVATLQPVRPTYGIILKESTVLKNFNRFVQLELCLFPN